MTFSNKMKLNSLRLGPTFLKARHVVSFTTKSAGYEHGVNTHLSVIASDRLCASAKNFSFVQSSNAMALLWTNLYLRFKNVALTLVNGSALNVFV